MLIVVSSQQLDGPAATALLDPDTLYHVLGDLVAAPVVELDRHRSHRPLGALQLVDRGA